MTHQTHRIHENSRKAWREINTSQRETEILKVFEQHGTLTDRQVCRIMGFPEMNNVRPRITEMIDSGVLVEVKKTRCPVTGKTVRACGLKGME